MYKPMTADAIISALTEMYEKMPPPPKKKEFIIHTNAEGKKAIDRAMQIEFLKQEINSLFGKNRLPANERDSYLTMLNSPDPDDLILVQTLIAKRYPSNSYFSSPDGYKVHIVGS